MSTGGTQPSASTSKRANSANGSIRVTVMIRSPPKIGAALRPPATFLDFDDFPVDDVARRAGLAVVVVVARRALRLVELLGHGVRRTLHRLARALDGCQVVALHGL